MITSPLPVYSSIFTCIYDEINLLLPTYFHYSVFRSYEYRNVCNIPVDKPLVHDFAVIWDDDHDERVIKAVENIYLAGLLSPIQFIGEHKGQMTIIIAARAWFGMEEPEQYVQKLRDSAFKLGDDIWVIRVGYFDRSDRDFNNKHQTDLAQIVGVEQSIEHTHIFNIDDKWKLGTKEFDNTGCLRMHIS